MKIIFNDKNIDEEIQGYTTINVEGRDLYVDDIETITIPGMDGAIFLGKNYNPRKLTVYFLVKAKSSLEHRKILEKLNVILNTETEVEFTFTDEEKCFYYGKVIGVNNPPVDSHNGIGNFEILCLDPFKHSEVKTVARKMVSKHNHEVKLENITATVNANTDKIILKNTTKGTKIILNGKFNINDKIEINLDEIKVNKADRKDLLDFPESDYMDFKLYNGDIITISGAKELIIKYRERWI